MRAVPLPEALVGDTILRGRPSDTRAAWQAAREADAADLNRLWADGEPGVYVVPLWSNADAERCLRELRGFDEARVYLEVVDDEEMEEALVAVAEAEWAGAAFRGADLARFLHAVASLEVPVFLADDPGALRALALALGEDLTPREIEAALRGEDGREPDAESLARARDLLAG